MELFFSKKQMILFLLLIYAFLLFIVFVDVFFIDVLLDVLGLRLLFACLIIFFIPGFLCYLLFFNGYDIINALPFIIASSVIILLSLLMFLNIIIGLQFSDFFTILLFILSSLPQITLLLLKKKDSYKIGFNYPRRLLLLISVLIVVRFAALFVLDGSIMGADVGRFSTLSHTMYLKKNITSDLRPFDIISRFFYFPGAFSQPLLFEFLGIDSITGVSVTALFFSIGACIIIFFMSQKFFSFKKSFSIAFFYSLMFDPVFNFSIFGLFSFAFALFFLLLVIDLFLNSLFNDKQNYLLLTVSFAGLLFFHYYAFFLLGVFTLSFLTYHFCFSKKSDLLRDFKYVAQSFFFSIVLLLPFLIRFFKHITIPFSKRYAADLLAMSSEKFGVDVFNRFYLLLFKLPTSPSDSPFFVIGLVCMMFLLTYKAKKTRLILLSFFYLWFFVFLLFPDNNLFRIGVVIGIFYSIGLGVLVQDYRIQVLIFLILPFVISPSPLFFTPRLIPETREDSQWVLWPGFHHAMSFIRNEIPENAVFLIDGGGIGCTGSSGNYGERIFPLTSRSIFYFTDTCWGDYDVLDYERKVEIYNEISINPDNVLALEKLKGYGVTHVYVGPYAIGLNAYLFLNSENYNKLFEYENTFVFEII